MLPIQDPQLLFDSLTLTLILSSTSHPPRRNGRKRGKKWKGKNTAEPKRMSYDYNITTLIFFLLLELSLQDILKTVLNSFKNVWRKMTFKDKFSWHFFCCLWGVGAVSLLYWHTYSQAFRMTDRRKRQCSSDSSNPTLKGNKQDLWLREESLILWIKDQTRSWMSRRLATIQTKAFRLLTL